MVAVVVAEVVEVALTEVVEEVVEVDPPPMPVVVEPLSTSSPRTKYPS